MKRYMVAVVLVILVMMVMSGCAPSGGGSSESSSDSGFVSQYNDKAIEFTKSLTANRYDECTKEFTDKLLEALPSGKLEEAYLGVIKDIGSYVKVDKTTATQKDGADIVVVYCVFEKSGLTVQLAYDSEGKISGVYFNYYKPDSGDKSSGKADSFALTQGVAQLDLVVGEGSKWELKAKLTSSATKSDTAVLMVHGSGPMDMDETVYDNKPFYDIAVGLAQQGVDSLRYNKRTFQYLKQLEKEDMSHFTVEDEVIADAILAGKLLRDRGYKKVYLLGHSLGGMLSMRIDSEGEGIFDGIIMLAGSPRTLTDIMLDQNLAALNTITDKKQKDDGLAIIEDEKAKLSSINTLTEEELLKQTVFGLPAYYLKEMNSVSTAELAKKQTKPVLVLQGGKDWQVYPDKDYTLWQELLKENDKAEFELYSELNHLFMVPQGTKQGIGNGTSEYMIKGTVDAKVIDRIAGFVKK